ncbi:sensor histidine kinase [Chitinophaga vietnamensis]|uniref:sensor histidine kinase n=1 Tax=Chitinophaga vietnamensis TaxID=2593957 RepID=UPI0013758BC4|nr:histidine kinase [Chitinophaga vietnamensis]
MLHTTFWTAFVTINTLILYVQNKGVGVSLLDAFVKYSTAIMIFYAGALLLLPNYLAKKKYFLFAIFTILVLVATFSIKYMLFKTVYPRFGYPPLPYDIPSFFAMHLWWWFHYTLFALGFWYATEAAAIERKRANIENERLKMEYAYLKARIDPHFLHNALNVFYSQALRVSQELAENIITLADFMRYSATGSDADGKTHVGEEVEQINKLIALNKLRFNDNIDVQFNTDPACYRKKVIPFLLITLVENAFKHGDIKPQSPLKIDLFLNTENHLQMLISNRKATRPNWQSSGIGLSDIRKRLAIEYGNEYNLDVQSEEDFFSVSLSIPC